ncbi:MAG: DsbA family oxidoreductase [Actinomycetota bacterium]|nr:DsbA family oxidoreductase [Actinomycetota bacterium]
MRVDIWSDVVCPWCYIGKRRFEAALARFEHRDDVEVSWHSFELDPAAPPLHEEGTAEHLAGKYGVSLEQARTMQQRMAAAAAAEGLDFHFERARSGNTFDAHRLLHLAADRGVQDAVKERLLAGYFTEGEPVGDHEALLRLGAAAGLDPTEARRMLESDGYAAEARADERRAAALGITGVPFFVIDDTYGVSGAQPADLLLEALRTAWAERSPLVRLGAAAAGEECADGSCAT